MTTKINPNSISKMFKVQKNKNVFICNSKGYICYKLSIFKNVIHKVSYKINNNLYEKDYISKIGILMIRIDLNKGKYIITDISVTDSRIKDQIYNINLKIDLINLNDIFNNIYLINLDRDKDKYENSRKLLDSFNIKFERFSASDGKELDDLENMDKYSYGCLLSHTRVIEDAIKNSYDKILILEDDIILHKNFNELFSLFYDRINSWDMLYLGCSQRPNTWHLVDIKNNTYKSKQCNGTFAYGLDNKIYKDVLEKYRTKLNYVDTLLHYIQDKFNCFSIIPNLIISDVTKSSIRNGRIMEEYAEIMGWDLVNYITYD